MPVELVFLNTMEMLLPAIVITVLGLPLVRVIARRLDPRDSSAPRGLANIEERVPFSPGVISAASIVLGNFFRSEYHSLQLRVERRMARNFSFSGSYALSKNLTNQPENTNTTHNIPTTPTRDALLCRTTTIPPTRPTMAISS